MRQDVETPLTDALIEKLLRGDGIPQCEEWVLLEEHAREMERKSYAYKAIAVAEMRPYVKQKHKNGS